jgi:hypothetical protein
MEMVGGAFFVFQSAIRNPKSAICSLGVSMKKSVALSLFLILSLLPLWAHSACRNPYLAEEDDPFILSAAASGKVEIKWFGHSFFQITSSSGTVVITDPFGAMGFPMPDVWAHVVTVGKIGRAHV